MESLDAPAAFMDDLLDFSSYIGEEEEEDDDETNPHHLHQTLTSLPLSLLSSRSLNSSGMVVEEEELEWISNKDAFPMVESFVDIMPNHQRPSLITDHQSPVSVLENSTSSFTSNGSNNTSSGGPIVSLCSNLKVPVRARSKSRKRRRRELFGGQQWKCWAKETQKISKPRGGTRPSSTLGRKCLHCQTEKTPQWRAGPNGPKTLCNACGVRYKSGRLVPEYRPASSPTFLSEVHSNSHRKIVEMRKQKHVVKPEVGLRPLEIG